MERYAPSMTQKSVYYVHGTQAMNDTSPASFYATENEKLNVYWSITTYVCTLSSECFNVENSESTCLS